MASFIPSKKTANDFNNNTKYVDYDPVLGITGDSPQAETINNLVESALFTQERADSAADSAASAEISADNANSSADEAKRQATNADNSAAQAATEAQAAKSSAQEAANTAASVVATAEEAKTNAENAATSASNAEKSANRAERAAINAESDAETARSQATSAAEYAENVRILANEASDAATHAEFEAEQASLAAQAASSSVDEAVRAAEKAKTDAENAVKNSDYAKALATNQPDDTYAGEVGTPRVSIEDAESGSPRFKFENLKGKDGMDGEDGKTAVCVLAAPDIPYNGETELDIVAYNGKEPDVGKIVVNTNQFDVRPEPNGTTYIIFTAKNTSGNLYIAELHNVQKTESMITGMRLTDIRSISGKDGADGINGTVFVTKTPVTTSSNLKSGDTTYISKDNLSPTPTEQLPIQVGSVVILNTTYLIAPSGSGFDSYVATVSHIDEALVNSIEVTVIQSIKGKDGERGPKGEDGKDGTALDVEATAAYVNDSGYESPQVFVSKLSENDITTFNFMFAGLEAKNVFYCSHTAISDNNREQWLVSPDWVYGARAGDAVIVRMPTLSYNSEDWNYDSFDPPISGAVVIARLGGQADGYFFIESPQRLSGINGEKGDTGPAGQSLPFKVEFLDGGSGSFEIDIPDEYETILMYYMICPKYINSSKDEDMDSAIRVKFYLDGNNFLNVQTGLTLSITHTMYQITNINVENVNIPYEYTEISKYDYNINGKHVISYDTESRFGSSRSVQMCVIIVAQL